MSARTARRALVSAGAAALVWPMLAWADKTIEAAPPNRFTAPELTMDQGERLVFRNGDTVSHDVTATTATSDGKPLFSTPIVAAGKEAFVEGSQYLTEGHYAYVCSLHSGMKGTIHVTGNGTAQPRPGTAPQSAPADKIRPTIAMKIVSRSVNMARARSALVVRVVLSERSHLELRAIARPKAGGPLVTIARRLLHKAEGTRRVHLGLTRAGHAALRRHRGLAVIVKAIAIDPSGNMTQAAHGRTLTP
ncbi:MAG: plastocyanin/azurin family copper-binding protein [Solirubrobacteraceae bacterium]